MVLSNEKKDITDKVIGKLKDGHIQLYLENEPIGKIHLKDGLNADIDPRFEASGGKIFQSVTVTDKPDMKYTDCDDGGWC